MLLAGSPLTLRQLLGGTYLAGIALLAIGVILVLGQQLSAYFRQDLLANGRVIIEQLAEDSRFALIQKAAENIQPHLDTAAAFPNVAGIVVATPHGETLAASGSHPILLSSMLPDGIPERSEKTPHIIETAHAITFVVAVRSPRPPSNFFARERTDLTANASTPLLGFVALTLTKAQFQADLRAINQRVLTVMSVGAVWVTVFALGILHRSTRPIAHLARVMSDPETVACCRPVEIRGVREAQSIGHAFNALIAQVAETTRELVASNAALRASEANLVQKVADATRELIEQNRELARAHEQAKGASRVKSAFMANMSHEIRTPLHGFMGFIDLLAKTPLDRLQQSYLHLLKHSAGNLLVVINGILDFSKLEAGKMPLHVRPFPLEDMIRTTVQLFHPNARAKGLLLEIDLDPHLPVTVWGDRQRLAQVVHNLVDNAIKFTAHGQVLVQVGGLPRNDGAFLCQLTVRDTGIGIPHDHQRTIFAAFNQVDASTTRQQGGTGLGLAICQQLLDLMQGWIEVNSQEGAGAEFRVTVPLPLADPAKTACASGSDAIGSEDDAGEPPPPLSPLSAGILLAERSAPEPRRGSKRVLVVDDHLTNRTYAKMALSSCDVEVVLAETGLAALEACRWQRFDAILMDIRMPGLDGLETTRRLRQWSTNPNCHIPIIGLTADLLNVDHPSWQVAGMNACLFKPLSEEQMSQVFAAWGIGPPSAPQATPNC